MVTERRLIAIWKAGLGPGTAKGHSWKHWGNPNNAYRIVPLLLLDFDKYAILT